MAGSGHNSGAEFSNSVASDELRSIVERYEALEAEKKDVAERMKEVMAEAKGRGYNTKVLRKLIAQRKKDQNALAEEFAIMELYAQALGMEVFG